MSELGNRKFLEESNTIGGMGAFVDDDEYSFQQYVAPTSQQSAASFSSQTMTGRPGGSISSSGYKPPTTMRGLDPDEPVDGPAFPFDINAFDPSNPDTYPHDWDDFDQWFEEYWMPNNSDMYLSLLGLGGTNSISGLGGNLNFGIPFTGDPATDAQFFLFFLRMNMASPPVFDENGELLGGGFCWGCSTTEEEEGDGTDEPGTP